MTTAVVSNATVTGFSKPTGAIKKLLTEYTTHAYILTDGIIICGRQSVKIGNAEANVNVYHAFPCKPFGMYSTESSNVTVHNASLLLDGLTRVEIHHDNGSEASRERGITFNTVVLKTQSGMTIRQDVLPFVMGDISVGTSYMTYAELLERFRYEHGSVLTEH